MTNKCLMLFAIAGLSPLLTAQPSGSAPQIFSSSVSYHVEDGSRAAYEQWLKDKFRRFSDGLIKADPALRMVTATRVVFGGVKEPEANAFVSYIVDGLPKNQQEIRDKVARQLFDKSYEDFLAEARPMRKRLGQTLSARGAGTPTKISDGDVIRIDYKRVTPGRMGDYVRLERDYERLRVAQVEAGSMKGWSMYTVVLPGGTEREYDAYTIHVGKDLEQVLTWGRNTFQIASKLNPPFDLTSPAMRGNELQKIVRGETRLVVMAVSRP